MAERDVHYSSENSDKTFSGKILSSIPKHFVVFDECGDLSTFTGSFGIGGTPLNTGSWYPITSSWSISSSWAPFTEFDDSHLLTTQSFNIWTGSSDSQFFGTSSFALRSYTASYGFHFTASESMIVETTSSDAVGYIDLFGGYLYGTASHATTASFVNYEFFTGSKTVATGEFLKVMINGNERFMQLYS